MMKNKSSSGIVIRTHPTPGDIGELIRLHGILYDQDYGYDITFEAYVAHSLAEFVLHHDPKKERIWLADYKGEIMGSIAIIKHSLEEAQLRWYLVTPYFRGKGLGKELIRKALDFAWQKKYKRIFLWTTSELNTAAYLYKKAGFMKTEEITHIVWGDMRTEEKYVLELPSIR